MIEGQSNYKLMCPVGHYIYIYLLVSDSFTEIEHFLNNYEYHKVINDVIITRNDIVSALITSPFLHEIESLR